MHTLFEDVCDSWHAELASRSTAWCQLHPHQDDRLWNAQEIVEHLVLACRSAGRVVETRLERRRRTRAHPTLVQRLLQFAVLSLGRMPRGAPAPPFTRPALLQWPPKSGVELAAVLREELEHTDQLLEQCRAQFGSRRAATHFLLGPLSADQWRRFHVIHLRHHLAQLQRIEKIVGQPSAEGTNPITAEKQAQ